MTQVTLHAGDNRHSLRRLIDQGVRVHSVVCDPPYNLTSITKRFGKKGSAPARREGNDGSFARLSGGFMNMTWDATGIERDPEFWKLVYDVLLPGGYVFAFSGARTGHWQAVAMETAGFIMHPMHGWVYGNGWPKPTYLTDEQWKGWGYGTQSQKPALEPIYLGQRPFGEKTGALNIAKHGVGAVNIDGCRVPTNGEAFHVPQSDPANRAGVVGSDLGISRASKDRFQAAQRASIEKTQTLGRSPSNLILDGSPDVVALFPSSNGDRRGKCNGTRPGGFGNVGADKGSPEPNGQTYDDSGSNARFFHQFAPTEEDYEWAIASDLISEDRGDAIVYNVKAGKGDRAGSKHPTVKPIALMQYLIRHITPPGGVVLDPFAGSGTTAEAARREGHDCIIMEAEPTYVGFLRSRFGLPADDNDFSDLLGDDIGIISLTGDAVSDENRSGTSKGGEDALSLEPDLDDILGEIATETVRTLASNESGASCVSEIYTDLLV